MHYIRNWKSTDTTDDGGDGDEVVVDLAKRKTWESFAKQCGVVGCEAQKRRLMEIRNTVKIDREREEEEENQNRSSLVDFREEVGAGRVWS